MRILAFSDWRTQEIDSFVRYIKNLPEHPDYIIYCGDDVDRFGYPKEGDLKKFLSKNFNRLIEEDKIELDKYSIGKTTLNNFDRTDIFLLVIPKDSNSIINKVEFVHNLSEDLINYYKSFNRLVKCIKSINIESNKIKQIENKIIEILKEFGYIKFERRKNENDIYIYIEKIGLSVYINKDTLEIDIYYTANFLINYLEEIIDENYYEDRISDKLIYNELANKKIFICSKNPLKIAIGDYSDENYFYELAKLVNKKVLVVVGNDDNSYSKLKILSSAIDINNKIIFDDDENIAFVGIDGSTGILGHTLYSEEQYSRELMKKYRKVPKNKNIILITHQPPYGILDLSIRFAEDKQKGERIGSKAVLNFIKKYNNQILINLCGHSHLNGGNFLKFRNSIILNISSHDSRFADGNVALIKIRDDDIDIKLDKIMNTSLERVPLIGPATSEKLQKNNIMDIIQLSETKPIDISKLRIGINHVLAERLVEHAKVILRNEPKIVKLPKIDFSNGAWIDIETENLLFGDGKIWAISIKKAFESEVTTFFAEDYSEEKDILTQFIDYIKMQNIKKLFYYSVVGAFDERVLIERTSTHNLNLPVLFCDFGHMFRDCVLIPSKSYGLKDVARIFGFEWKCPDISGFLAPFLYDEYRKGKEKKLKEKLILYNQDDVLAMEHLARKIGLKNK